MKLSLSALVLVLSASLSSAVPVREEPEPRATLAKVYTSCVNAGQAAITLDDGPYLWLYDISKFLIAANAKGTFWFNGNNFACIYDADSQKRVKYAYAKGHQIGSHTWSHPDLTKLTYSEINTELARIEQALQRIIGVQPALMRPPYGYYNNLVRQVVHDRNQSLVTWDVDSRDADGATLAQSMAIYNAAVAKNPRSILTLNHETHVTTAHKLIPWLIKLLQSKKYKLVTVAECLNTAPYQYTKAPQTPSPSWTC